MSKHLKFSLFQWWNQTSPKHFNLSVSICCNVLINIIIKDVSPEILFSLNANTFRFCTQRSSISLLKLFTGPVSVFLLFYIPAQVEVPLVTKGKTVTLNAFAYSAKKLVVLRLIGLSLCLSNELLVWKQFSSQCKNLQQISICSDSRQMNLYGNYFKFFLRS